MSDQRGVTTPIYYVNARPHIGHTYTTIVCDTITRYHKAFGRPFFFLTGTDEHGDKIVQSAARAGQSPREYTDEVSGEFRAVWQELGIGFDDFIRTTEDRHKVFVQKILTDIYRQGDIYLGEYEGNYCTGCERYLTGKELDEQGRCLIHLTIPEHRIEKNYFFRIRKYLPLLQEYYEHHPDAIYPDQYFQETLGLIRELIASGEDLSISRPVERLSWGIPLPFDNSYVTYVWFDALLNYVSALGGPGQEKYERFWPLDHVIGKDILKPHSVIWPAMLIASGIPVFRRLAVHGYWLGFGDMKMSKSLGNAVDPLNLVARIGRDEMRYFLMREMAFGSDARFSEEGLQRRINSDLANDLGNCTQRTLAMLKKYRGGIVNVRLEEEEQRLTGLWEEAAQVYHDGFRNYQIHRSIESVMRVVSELNSVIEKYQPWTMAKNQDERLIPLLHTILRSLVVAWSWLTPVLPEKSAVFFNILSLPHGPYSVPAEVQFRETALEEWPMLFPRLQIAGGSE